MLLSLAPDLARGLAGANFTQAAVRELLGEAADHCRVAGEFDLPLVTLGEPSTQLAALIRLFLLPTAGECALPADVVALALPGLAPERLTAAGLLQQTAGGRYTASLAITPHTIHGAGHTRDYLVLSDVPRELSLATLPSDYVMGVGGATRTLLSHVGAVSGMRVFELGTGCGIVALHLASAGARVTATDISERALTFALVNEVLNPLGSAATTIDWRLGSMFEPVRGECFDLAVSNPPFVISPVAVPPAGAGTADVAPVLEYRSSALVGDALSRELITSAREVLRPGGQLVCLANWEACGGSDTLDTVRSWAEQAGAASAFIVQREHLTPAEYAAMWHRDSGSRPESLAAALADFAARGVTGIGMGVVHLRAAGEQTSAAEEAAVGSHIRGPEPVSPKPENPGPEAPEPEAPEPEAPATVFAQKLVGAPASTDFAESLAATWHAAEFAHRLGTAELLATRWLCAPHVDDVRTFAPGAADPSRIVLHTTAPYSAVAESETLAAALVGACDGELSLGQIAGALAELLQVPADVVAAEVVAVVRRLAPLGFLTPIVSIDEPATD